MKCDGQKITFSSDWGSGGFGSAHRASMARGEQGSLSDIVLSTWNRTLPLSTTLSKYLFRDGILAKRLDSAVRAREELLRWSTMRGRQSGGESRSSQRLSFTANASGAG
jgi:hypothetical protein